MMTDVKFGVGARVLCYEEDSGRLADRGSVVGHAFTYDESGNPYFVYLVHLDAPCQDSAGQVFPYVAAFPQDVRDDPDVVRELIHGRGDT